MFWDKRLPQDYEDILVQYGAAPHCDAAILHKPGECIYCDEYPALQGYRLAAGISFTGHSDDVRMTTEGPSGPLEARCWAEVGRDTLLMYRWAGNRPQKNKPYEGPKVGNG